MSIPAPKRLPSPPRWRDAAGALVEAQAELRAAVDAVGRACTLAAWCDEAGGGDGALASEVDVRARSLLLALSALEMLVEEQARREAR